MKVGWAFVSFLCLVHTTQSLDRASTADAEAFDPHRGPSALSAEAVDAYKGHHPGQRSTPFGGSRRPHAVADPESGHWSLYHKLSPSSRSDNRLVVMPTFNVLHRTMLGVNTMLFNNTDRFDLLVIDDGSTDDTVKWLKSRGVMVLVKSKQQGLTHSWNVAYDLFMHSRYRFLFIVNNDILLPTGCISELSSVLHRTPFVVPMSTHRGAGYAASELNPIDKTQSLEHLYQITSKSMKTFVNDPIHFQAVQDWILDKLDPSASEVPGVVMPHFNGFFLGFNKGIKRAAFSEHELFFVNPIHMSMHQEEDLKTRLKVAQIPITVVPSAFAYHFLSSTFSKFGFGLQDDRNQSPGAGNTSVHYEPIIWRHPPTSYLKRVTGNNIGKDQEQAIQWVPADRLRDVLQASITGYADNAPTDSASTLAGLAPASASKCSSAVPDVGAAMSYSISLATISCESARLRYDTCYPPQGTTGAKSWQGFPFGVQHGLPFLRSKAALLCSALIVICGLSFLVLTAPSDNDGDAGSNSLDTALSKGKSHSSAVHASESYPHRSQALLVALVAINVLCCGFSAVLAHQVLDDGSEMAYPGLLSAYQLGLSGTHFMVLGCFGYVKRDRNPAPFTDVLLPAWLHAMGYLFTNLVLASTSLITFQVSRLFALPAMAVLSGVIYGVWMPMNAQVSAVVIATLGFASVLSDDKLDPSATLFFAAAVIFVNLAQMVMVRTKGKLGITLPQLYTACSPISTVMVLTCTPIMFWYFGLPTYLDMRWSVLTAATASKFILCGILSLGEQVLAQVLAEIPQASSVLRYLPLMKAALVICAACLIDTVHPGQLFGVVMCVLTGASHVVYNQGQVKLRNNQGVSNHHNDLHREENRI